MSTYVISNSDIRKNKTSSGNLYKSLSEEFKKTKSLTSLNKTYTIIPTNDDNKNVEIKITSQRRVKDE